jgi:transposase
MTGKPSWQAIPTKLSEAQFEEFVLPHLSRGRRGPPPTLSLHKIFNYILKALYMGCQWRMLPIDSNDVMIVGDDLPINSKRQMAAALPAAVITRSLPRKAAPGRVPPIAVLHCASPQPRALRREAP